MKKYLFSAMAALVLLASKLGCSGDSHAFVPTPSVKPTSVEISPNSSLGPIELKVGETQKLSAKVLPENAENKQVTWESWSDAVTVNKDGLLTAVRKGDAIITATAVDGGAWSLVRVNVLVEVEKVRIIINPNDPYPIKIPDIHGYNPIVLKAEVLPTDASDKRLIWTSSNTNVAVVLTDQATDQVLVMGIPNITEGRATITATSASNGNAFGTCEVIVLPGPPPPATDIALSPSTLEMAVGNVEKIFVIPSPINAAIDANYLTCEIVLPNEDDLPPVKRTVTSAGIIIEALRLGSAFILATYEPPGARPIYSGCTVTVTDHIEYVAGVEIVGGVSVAKLWKNGSAMELSDRTRNGDAKSVSIATVSGLTVAYVAGDETGSDNVSTAKVWVNSNANTITLGDGKDSKANSVFADGSDFYVAGYQSDGARKVPVVWKNGPSNPTRLTVDDNGDAEANCIVHKEGYDYVVGHGKDSRGIQVPIYWKGGVPMYLTIGGRVGSANSVFVAEDDSVWIAGWVNNDDGVPMAALWKNGVRENILPTMRSSVANSVYVTMTKADDGINWAPPNIHVAGYESNGQVPTARIWEGTTTLATGYLDGGGTESRAYSVFVDSQNVYVAGFKNNSSFAPEARVWKNDREMPPIAGASIAKAIAVK